MKIITITLLLASMSTLNAQPQIVFKNGFEQVIVILNDTGINYAAEFPSGNNVDCTSNSISAVQDCHLGRDFTHNDDSDGLAGFSYTKLDNNGDDLPASAATWSCVRDNVTGFVWEVKTDDNSIHDLDTLYRWGGVTHQGNIGTDFFDDWDSLVNGSKNENFCGFNDWRVPTRLQLKSLLNFSQFSPAIDDRYFPNVTTDAFSTFWTATPGAKTANSAWLMAFDFGRSGANGASRSNSYSVRLVRYDPYQ